LTPIIEILKIHWIAIAAISVPLGFLCLLFFAGLLERRLARPYVRLKDVDAHANRIGSTTLNYDGGLPDASLISEYVEIMSRDIQAAGFRFGGTLAHAKTKQNKIISTVWMSPDQRIVVYTGAGTVLDMPTRQTWCYTPLSDGTFLVTTDQNDEGDTAGVYRYRRLLNVPFAQLLEVHQKRMASTGNVRAFEEVDPFEAVLSIQRFRLGKLLEGRLARWRDSDEMWWSYTVKGSFLIFPQFFRQLIGGLGQFWRVNRKPIGSHLPRNSTGT